MKLGITLSVALSLVLFLLIGCGAGGNSYESDDPSYRESTFQGGDSTGSADAGAAPATPDDKNGEAQRAIQEADIIKVVGTKLYALSKYGGLSVIEVGVKDQLTLLGRHRLEAIPFEMYVENDVVYAMLSTFGRYDQGRWIETSEVLAFDVKDPGHIAELAHFDIPGEIADSRMVGEVMYVVTYRNGHCWRCGTSPSTTVTSFHVTPQAIAQIDQIDYTSPQNYGWWQRSITVTPTRMYVSGPDWGSWQPNGSVIQVIDISDPNGLMKKGADVKVAGSITSRWQMDEYQGVLRVISQPFQWSGTVPPQVQTFKVNSTNDIVPLGKTDIVLPMRESLQSVRFDGTRAYAITVERKDPLFTIDLTNPAQPKQMGELKMPGWVYFMEPRGDRLVGLGFDQDNNQGSLNVSLFDVSDLTNPTMIKRVSFAQGWSQLPEDQDRIQKAFQVLDSQNMILVPFASYGKWTGTTCAQGQSGIQIVDYTHDDLVLRGVAKQEGQPRRAFMQDDRLFAMSDRHVTTYDITDRSAPVQKAELDLSTPAFRVATVGKNLVQLSNSWWTGEATISIVPRGTAETAEPIGKLSLVDMAPSEQWRCSWGNTWTAWYSASLFPHGDSLIVAVPIYSYSYNYQSQSAQLVIGVVDLRDPTHPKIAGKTTVPLSSYNNSYGYYGYYGYYGGVLTSGTGIVQIGDALAYMETKTETTSVGVPIFGNTGTRYETHTTRKMHVIDVGDITAPKLSGSIDLPSESRGASPLVANGTQVLTTRWDPVDGNPSKVKFWVDRIDVADAKSPKKLDSVNVPGSLILADGSRWVTVDYKRIENGKTGPTCWQSGGWWDKDKCISFERSLNLLEISGSSASRTSKIVPPQQNLGGVIASGNRVYVTRYPSYDTVVSSDGYSYSQPKDGGLFVYGEDASGLSLLSYTDGAYRYPVAVDGSRVALAENDGVAFYDSSASGLREIGRVQLRGWGYSNQVKIEGSSAVCALGEWGVQTVALSP